LKNSNVDIIFRVIFSAFWERPSRLGRVPMARVSMLCYKCTTMYCQYAQKITYA